MENSAEIARMRQVSRNPVRARPPRPTFKTHRLRLRMLRLKDKDFLAALDADPDVMRYIHGGPLSHKAAMKWAETQIEMARFRWHLHKWIVELREDHTRVGWVELSKFRGVFDRDEKWTGDDVNLGYQFDKAHWNQGFASEALRPVLAYAFSKLELQRVVAFAREDNGRSLRVLEKLGFRRRALSLHKDESGQECPLFALAALDWRP